MHLRYFQLKSSWFGLYLNYYIIFIYSQELIGRQRLGKIQRLRGCSAAPELSPFYYLTSVLYWPVNKINFHQSSIIIISQFKNVRSIRNINKMHNTICIQLSIFTNYHTTTCYINYYLLSSIKEERSDTEKQKWTRKYLSIF